MSVLEILLTVVGIIAGISGAAWDIYQLLEARSKKRAAITIQRAYRRYRETVYLRESRYFRQVSCT